MSYIVIDTDVALTILRGRLFDPTVLRDWGPRRLASFDSWRHQVIMLPYDEAVAVKCGRLQADAQLRGRPRLQRQLDRRLLPRPHGLDSHGSRGGAPAGGDGDAQGRAKGAEGLQRLRM